MRKIGLPLAALLSLLAAVPVRAQFIPIGQPGAAYLNATAPLPVTDPDFTVVNSLTDGTTTVSFDTDMVALTVPDTWATWGAPPNTEGPTPRVLWTQGFSEITLAFSTPLRLFGFEAQPNTAVVSPITATFRSGTSIVGEILLDVDGNGGARLFAASSGMPFNNVVLSSTDDFAIAQVRVPGQVVPEPGVQTILLSMGFAGLVMIPRVRQRIVLLRRMGRLPG